MDRCNSRFGESSAWRIFPLGVVAGAIVVLIPLLTYLVLTQPDGLTMDVAVFVVGAFSVVFAFVFLLLGFLWVAQWATEEADERGEAPAARG